MYNTKETFALAMSEQLFDMRIETPIPYGDNEDPVPIEFAHKIVDDPEHMLLIKKRIYDNIMAQTPDDKYNEYYYTSDTYDHAFAIDTYVDEAWREELEALENEQLELEALEEAQRQARLIVTYAIRTEVIRIETDPEDGEEEELETDSICISRKFVDYETATFLQNKMMEHLKAQ